MDLLCTLDKIWNNDLSPFLIHDDSKLTYADVCKTSYAHLSGIKKGDVVALIGDFNPIGISNLIQLIQRGAIIVPLTMDSENDHPYFFESAYVQYVVNGIHVYKINCSRKHILIDELRKRGNPGLILFSTGTTGRPKAILHDFYFFLKRFLTPRPSQTTINFLLFDHIGGINTLFHTLFNKGVVVAPKNRNVDVLLETIQKHNVEVLPTTPTFLRMLLVSGLIPHRFPSCLKIVTYGTERMDQPTLDALCELLPEVDFRQTFGMSELGIVRVKSLSRNSLYMHIGGEGVETRVLNKILQIRSATRMLGYLNAESPFDQDGWYDTKDVVDISENGAIRVIGRLGDVVNVGGLKFMASDVERVAIQYPNVALVKVTANNNPITGQHVELIVQPIDQESFDKGEYLKYLRTNLQPHMMPKRVSITSVAVGHRFKKS